MKRKHGSLGNAFRSCAGTPGLCDEALRRVLAKLEGLDKPTHVCRHLEQRFPEVLPLIQQHSLPAEGGEDFKVWTTRLSLAVEHRCQQSSNYHSALRRIAANGPTIGVVYLDEVVPGNVLRPDNRRRSYCLYFSFLHPSMLRSELGWIPVAVRRSTITASLKGKVAGLVSHVIRCMAEDFTGFAVDKSNPFLVVVQCLYMVADEAAIKAAAGSKGASGLRPCLRCNAVYGQQTNLRGFPSISEDDYRRFVIQSDQDVKDTMTFLQQHADRPTRLKEFEILSCKSSFLNNLLSRLLVSRSPPCVYVLRNAF